MKGAKKIKTTSVFLPEELKMRLKEKAKKKGMGYQTFLKMIVMDNI